MEKVGKLIDLLHKVQASGAENRLERVKGKIINIPAQISLTLEHDISQSFGTYQETGFKIHPCIVMIKMIRFV